MLLLCRVRIVIGLLRGEYNRYDYASKFCKEEIISETGQTTFDIREMKYSTA